eukprot:6178709-Pleurochrysis_carterae.AAC.1
MGAKKPSDRRVGWKAGVKNRDGWKGIEAVRVGKAAHRALPLTRAGRPGVASLHGLHRGLQATQFKMNQGQEPREAREVERRWVVLNSDAAAKFKLKLPARPRGGAVSFFPEAVQDAALRCGSESSTTWHMRLFPKAQARER